MAYILYSKEHGPLALVEGSVLEAQLQEGEIAIPCEPDADVNDRERWEIEAAYMVEQYAPSLELAQAMKREELVRTRDVIVERGFLYNGHVFPIGPDIQVTMLMQFTASQVMPAPSYSWKDIDGLYRTIGDVTKFQTFMTMALMYGQSLFAREEMLQTLVNSAGNIEAVAAIGWDTVPDGPV